jgi:hypothetical protein
VSVLELDREAKIEARAGLPHLGNDTLTMGDIAHVVVGHFEDEEILQGQATNRKSFPWFVTPSL